MDAIETYLEQVKSRLVAEPMQKEAILSELRSHLWEQVHDQCAREPEADEQALLERVLHRFGDPDAVARAYREEEPPAPAGDSRSFVVVLDGSLLREARHTGNAIRSSAARGWARTKTAGARLSAWGRRQAPRTTQVVATLVAFIGRILLWTSTLLGHLLRWIGRAFGTTMKWAGVSLLVLTTLLLALALFAGLFLFDDIRAEVESRQEMRVLGMREDCWSTPCTTGPTTTVFHVPERANRLGLYLQVTPHPEYADTSGALRITVTDPNGKTLLERGFEAGHATDIREHHHWAPEPGNWIVQHETDGFHGWLRVNSDVRGI